jgi:Lrp/AsnC family transcriptional regulator for asnA, asnC and gidA
VNKPTTIPLDDTDRQLIEALQRDGRASYAVLAELVTLSPAATRLRVQRLRSRVAQCGRRWMR